MAIALVQSNSAYAGAAATTITCQFLSNTTTGNTLIVYGGVNADGTDEFVSVSDGTNTYTKRAATFSTNDTFIGIIFDAVNITGATTPTLTLTFDEALESRLIHIAEFSGLSTAPFDQANANAQDTPSGTDAVTSGTVVTTQADELIVGGAFNTNIASPATYAAGTNFTALQTADTTPWNRSEYRIVSSTGTYAATWTPSDGTSNSVACVATYKAASVAPNAPNVAETTITVTDAPTMRVPIHLRMEKLS